MAPKEFSIDGLPPVLNHTSTPPRKTDWILRINPGSSGSSIERISLCKCDGKSTSHRHCPFCPHKTRSAKNDLLKYLNTHKKRRNATTICTICDQAMNRKSLTKHLRTKHQTYLQPKLAAVAVGDGIFFVRSKFDGVAYGTHVDLNEGYCELCSKKHRETGTNECEHIQAAQNTTPYSPSDNLPMWYIQASPLKRQEKGPIMENVSSCRKQGLCLVDHLPAPADSTTYSLSIHAVYKEGINSCLRIGALFNTKSQTWTLSKETTHEQYYIAVGSLYLNYLRSGIEGSTPPFSR